MWSHRYLASVGFAAAFTQVTNEFLARFELCARGLISIEIAHETNAERNIVQIIAVHVATIDLTTPTVAHFYLPVPGRRAIPDHEMISKPVLHSADVPMVIIEYAGVALAGSTIVHDDELPATPFHGRASDRFDH